PKMAYRVRRERGQGVRTLVEALLPAMDAVITGTPEKQKERFDRFVEFFEAILAYHKSYGGF
nr:type III-A CRISPR-associated protein Csm2 [Longilinea sp.]